MTKIEELEQNINLMSVVIKDAQEALNKYQKALAELKESKKEGKWTPKEHEKFWFRDTAGDSCYCYYAKGKSNHDWKINNLPIFPTAEECERYWHFMDTVKEKSYGFSREDFENDDITEYTIEFNGKAKEFRVGSFCRNRELGCIYFKTEADAQFIIDNFKEELLEYWL